MAARGTAQRRRRSGYERVSVALLSTGRSGSFWHDAGRMADDLATQVAKALDEMRPYLEKSGADVRLVRVEHGVAHVIAVYGPRGYLLSIMSFVAGIERALIDKVPNLRGIVPVNLPPYSGVGWDDPSFTKRLVEIEPQKPEGRPAG